MQHRLAYVVVTQLDPIPGADRIELAHVRDVTGNDGQFKTIIMKGQYAVGDRAVYIPADSIVPVKLLALMGLEGRLSGHNKNRVKATRMRGVFSEGLLLDFPTAAKYLAELPGAVVVGRINIPPAVDGKVDVSQISVDVDNSVLKAHIATFKVNPGEALGITKYVPEIPVSMSGKVIPILGHAIRYDIENIKWFPNVFQEGEPVAISEKIHGTYLQAGLVYTHTGSDTGLKFQQFYTTSKGLAGKLLAFAPDTENIYTQVARELNLEKILERLAFVNEYADVWIMGEVFGEKVQDLRYGVEGRQFRVFDIAYRVEGDPHVHYCTPAELKDAAFDAGIPIVDFLFTGPYSGQIVSLFTDGMTVTGKGSHIREGVVIRPEFERWDEQLGRVILKSVSEAYLTRKAEAGQEATEYA
jgi:RNA ligase (TIGR02306 family)